MTPSFSEQYQREEHVQSIIFFTFHNLEVVSLYGYNIRSRLYLLFKKKKTTLTHHVESLEHIHTTINYYPDTILFEQESSFLWNICSWVVKS